MRVIKEISSHCSLDPAICCVQGDIIPGYSGVKRLQLCSLLSMFFAYSVAQEEGANVDCFVKSSG